MPSPGWYPDPNGAGCRYWDGHAWAPAAEPDAPPPKRDWLLPAVAVIVILTVVLSLAIWRPWAAGGTSIEGDTNSASPAVPAWDETSTPSVPPEPTSTALPDDSGGRPVDCPVGNGHRIEQSGNVFSSGGLAFDGIPGWADSRGYSLDMASDISGQSDRVTDSWVALTAIGWLDIEVFSHPRQATRQVLDCLSTSYYYPDLSHREFLESRNHPVGSRPGWLIRANLWNKKPHAVLGDEIIVLVVDTGQPGKLAVFHAEAPIGDRRRIEMINKALASIRLA